MKKSEGVRLGGLTQPTIASMQTVLEAVARDWAEISKSGCTAVEVTYRDVNTGASVTTRIAHPKE